jgi:hypothetical protein
MITVPLAVQQSLDAGTAQVRFWWRIDTSPVTAIWTGSHALSWDSLTWTPLPWAPPPQFAAFSADGSVQQTRVSLAVPANLTDQLFDAEDLGLRRVRAGFLVADASGAVLFSRRLCNQRVDQIEQTDAEGGLAVVTVTTAGRLADARRNGHRIASHTDQLTFRDAADGFFKQTATNADVEIIIGGRGPAAAGGGGTRFRHPRVGSRTI